MVSSAYLRLVIFLPAILIPAYASSSPAFLMMCSACKLHKQGDDIQSWRTPFLIWNQSVVPCPVLTVASWPAYRFPKRQVKWSGIPISSTIFHSLLWFKIVRRVCFLNFPRLDRSNSHYSHFNRSRISCVVTTDTTWLCNLKSEERQEREMRTWRRWKRNARSKTALPWHPWFPLPL